MLTFALRLTGFSIIGLAIAWCAVSGGTARDFLDVPSLFFVAGLTLGGVLVSSELLVLLEAICRALIANGGDDAAKHARQVAALGKARQYAWAAGILGLLMGLVVMLQNLDDPPMIGAAIAVGSLPVLYGGFLAELIFSPLQQALINSPPREKLQQTHSQIKN